MAKQAIRKQTQVVSETKQQAELRELWAQVSKLMEKIIALEGSNDNGQEQDNGR